MTIVERARAYDRSDAAIRYPSSSLWLTTEKGRDVAYGRWVMGNDYRVKSKYYGGFPPGFLDRLIALFPDVPARRVLHVFSGALPAGAYTRCDINPATGAEIVCDARELPRHTPRVWKLVVADPPYSSTDAQRYGTLMINRLAVLNALAEVVVSGGYLAWLDQCWPQHRAEHWATVARIAVTRCTNHRTRDLTIFQRRLS